MSGILSGQEIKGALLDASKKDQWIPLFEGKEFDSLPPAKGIGIFPFIEENLEPISYDLTVGNQSFSLRRKKENYISAGIDYIKLDPGETVLILSQEYIALGPEFAAVTLSKAGMMNEGILLSSAKIDPTWFGCVPIPITNNSQSTFILRHGEPFCTIIFFQLDKPIKPDLYLTKRKTSHLGQLSLSHEPKHGSPWEPKRRDTVRDEDMDEAVTFGPPFDIVRGMFDWNRQTIVDYMEKTWGTKALVELKRSVWEEEFDQIKKYREEEILLLKEQIQILKSQGEERKKELRNVGGLLITFILATLTWIATAIGLLIKIHGSSGP